MKSIITCVLAILLLSVACTDNFENLNKDPNEVTDESLKQDFNNVGAYFPTLLQELIPRTNWQFQVAVNLSSDAFVRHLAAPTPFMNNRNNTTYYITWNDLWNFSYRNIMSPVREVTKVAKALKYDVFENWAKLIRIISASQLAAYYGPIIYTNYGKTGTVEYDSEEVLYKAFFKELDEVLKVFNENKKSNNLKNFDASYAGAIPKWIKVINSLRLRLAMRLAKANPALAKKEAEKALADTGGLILTNADNFNVSLYGRRIAEADICFSWGDTRMSATMESVLVGYKDPRIEKFFEPATVHEVKVKDKDGKDTDKLKYPNPYKDSKYPYKGVMAGSELKNKALRQSYSTVSENFKSFQKRIVISASEILFLKAEAALRGWAKAGTAKANYESAVKASFAQWGASGADAYLQNNTDLPIDYVDVVAPEDEKTKKKDYNNFTNRIKVHVKWDDAGSNEKKLEQIITQKWIAFFTYSIEAWVDQRRTGYPKLPYNTRNDSNADFGVIGKTDFIRRMPYWNNEINNNAAGVKAAVGKLQGGTGDNGGIGARLYFDANNLGKASPVNF